MLTIEEVALYLHLTKVAVYGMVRRREIPFYKIGRRLRFKQNDLDSWLEGQKVQHIPLEERVKKMMYMQNKA